jgi:anti-sigma28 factor (negative regulator of flagellin synthesis)
MRLQLDSSQISTADNRANVDSRAIVDNRAAEAVTKSGDAAHGASARGAGAGDSISLSGASNALNQFTAHRSARIQQLTAAVQNGSYHVSSSALSSAIVRNGLA